jgi:hypothetical protein
MFAYVSNVLGQSEQEQLATSITTSEVPLAIVNNPGYQNIVVGKLFSHKLELVNPDKKKVHWAFDGQVPNGFLIKQDGTIECNINQTNVLQNHVNYSNEYEIRFIAKNLDNPTERVSDSFKVKFYPNEPEKPSLILA